MTWTQNATRTLLVLFTCIVAVRAPYFGSVLGTVGGLTDALQAFVLPAMICRRYFGSSMSSSGSIFYYIVLLWGVGVMIYTSLGLCSSTFVFAQ